MGRNRLATVLPVLAVLLVIATAVAVLLVVVQPFGDDDDGNESTATTAGEREPQVSPRETTTTNTTPVADDLLGGDLPAAYQDLLAAAGQPGQVLEVEIHDTYAFLAYRDPADPSVINVREWRNGRVGDARANPIEDRVDETTEPSLFGPAELDPTIVAQLVADAPLQYDIPVTVTHVIIDRFLPFDQRVLVRVYTVPTDGRSGGGYVSYDTAGALVNVCC